MAVHEDSHLGGETAACRCLSSQIVPRQDRRIRVERAMAGLWTVGLPTTHATLNDRNRARLTGCMPLPTALCLARRSFWSVLATGPRPALATGLHRHSPPST